MSTVLDYAPPPYGVGATPEERIGEFEDALITDLRKHVREGHDAVAMAGREDHGRWLWDLFLDEDVWATVQFVAGEDGSEANIRLIDLDTMIRGGAVISRIAAPPENPIAWFAVAIVASRPLLTRDLSGYGQLADSKVPLGSGTYGEWLRGYSQRSGKPQVEKRRRKAVGRLYKGAGGKTAAQRVVDATCSFWIRDWWEASSPALWVAGDQSGPDLEQLTKPYSIPDRIVRELQAAAGVQPGRTRPDAATGGDDGTPWASAVVVREVEPWFAEYLGVCLGCGKSGSLHGATARRCQRCWALDNATAARAIEAMRLTQPAPEPIYEKVLRKRQPGEMKYAKRRRDRIADPTGDRAVTLASHREELHQALGDLPNDQILDQFGSVLELVQISDLTAFELDVLRREFVLDQKQAEIAVVHGVQQPRISKARAKALAKLRQKS